MDTDDLSTETYQGILIEAEKFNHDLTIQFEASASHCKNEEEYFNKVTELIDELRSLDEEEFTEVFFGNLTDTKSLSGDWIVSSKT